MEKIQKIYREYIETPKSLENLCCIAEIEKVGNSDNLNFLISFKIQIHNEFGRESIRLLSERGRYLKISKKRKPFKKIKGVKIKNRRILGELIKLVLQGKLHIYERSGFIHQ